MRAILKGIYDNTVDGSLKEFFPADPRNFDTQLTLYVGSEGTTAEEMFYLKLSSLDFDESDSFCYKWYRYTLFVNFLEYNSILDVINSKVSSFPGKSWEEIRKGMCGFFYFGI
ncbi:Imm8 family immunity protein [Asaia sp. HN010]|uniref:Imm8 family immunity protein n=1 Tax=Asaia sp. HN010 TaxID=3081233 RepID=UPI0038D01B0D